MRGRVLGWWRGYLRNLSGTIARVVIAREVPTVKVVHLWRDKWTALSGPLSIIVHGLGEGSCCPLKLAFPQSSERGTYKTVTARFWP